MEVDIVGFGQYPALVEALSCITENSGNTFIDAQDGDALTRALEELIGAAVQRSYLRVIAVGPDGQPVGEGHPWCDVVELISLADEQGIRAQVAEGALSGEVRRTLLLDTGEQRFELPPGTYQFTLYQNLGHDNLRGCLPENNTEQTYTARIVEGQDTVAIIGVGALLMTSEGGDPAYACDLKLEIARWLLADGLCCAKRILWAQKGVDLAVPLQPNNRVQHDATDAAPTWARVWHLSRATTCLASHCCQRRG